MKVIEYHVHTTSAVLISRFDGDPNTAVSHDYLPGSTLRGALIAAAVADGVARERLRDEAAFFFDESTRFLNGYPADDEGRPYTPTPLSWRMEKGRDDRVYDLAAPQDSPPSRPQNAKGGYARVGYDGVTFYPSRDHRELTVHAFRNRKKGRPVADEHAEGDPGGVFRYDALAAGQTFVTYIVCETETVADRLRGLIKRLERATDPIRIGRSRRAGYGEVEWALVNADASTTMQSRLPERDEPLVVTFLSDALIRDGAGAYSTDVRAITHAIEKRLGLGVSLGEPKRSFIRSDYAGGVDRTWRSPLPQALAVQKGSRILYSSYPQGAPDWESLIRRGIGDRRPEGFGDVTCNRPADSTAAVRRPAAPSPVAVTADADPPFDADSPERLLAARIAERLVRNRLDTWLVTEIEMWGVDAAGTARRQLSRLRAAALRALDAVVGSSATSLSPEAVEAIDALRDAGNLEKLRSRARDQLQKVRVQKRGRSTLILLDRWMARLVGDKGTPFEDICGEEPWVILSGDVATGRYDVGQVLNEDQSRSDVRVDMDSLKLRGEYTLRLIDGVLARAMKLSKGAKGGFKVSYESHVLKSREITTRIVVTGRLVAETPLHLGAGDVGDIPLDMALLRDPHTHRPLLTGATLAGALRAYLVTHGLGAEAKLLFGGERAEDGGDQSPLIVDDAVADGTPIAELRDGVGLNPASKTAADGALYDLELWAAGTTFPLHLELALHGEAADEDKRKPALGTALQALERGEISIGLRKTRGYGRLHLHDVTVQEYDLKSPEGLVQWLFAEGDALDGLAVNPAPSLALNHLGTPLRSSAPFFSITGEFALDAPLLIRGRADGSGVDAAYLRARGADGQVNPVLAGTSLAGALRARARRMLHALRDDAGADHTDADGRTVDAMFGRAGGEGDDGATIPPLPSRLLVDENAVSNGTTDLYQHRIRIDRFTAGVADTALFDENPVFPKDAGSTTVPMRLRLRDPEPHEIGVLLHLVKDLWTGDLPVGGTTSVGRGALAGKCITLEYTGGDLPWSGVIKREGDGDAVTLDGLSIEQLNCYAAALGTWMEADA